MPSAPPLLFTLYINKLGDVLPAPCRDIPRAGRKNPALLYADDALLIAWAAVGLQNLLNTFIDFMDSLDLSTYLSKSHTLTIGSQKVIGCKFFCRGVELTNVSTFPYLGVLFDDRGSWVVQKVLKKITLARAVGATMDFAKRLGAKPVPALIKVSREKMYAYGHLRLRSVGVQRRKRTAGG